MKEAIASIFVFGWIDLLNPVSVSMVMLLPQTLDACFSSDKAF